MALKAILDSIDDLPDPLKSEYVEKNGKYELQVEGMKTEADLARVQTALTKERADHKVVREQLTSFKTVLGDRKVEDVLTQLDRIPELEAAAAGKLDDEKINQIVETRIKTKLAPVERELNQYKTQVAEKDKVIEGYTVAERTRKIHDAVRKAATAAKVLPEAIEDALNLADRVFELDESGKVITKEGVGVTQGIEPSVWFIDLQKTRAHWWGQSSGGGAGGNRGGDFGGKNPFSAEHWNMTEQGKLVVSDRAKAEQLAKAAGTTIGGKKPAPKK